MIVSMGKGTDELLAELRESGVKIRKLDPDPGPNIIHAAAGDILEILQDADVCEMLAAMFATWMAARASRRIKIWSKDGGVVELHGYSASNIAQLLGPAQRVDPIDLAGNIDSPFEWTYPVYILAKKYRRDVDRGSFTFTDDTILAVPEVRGALSLAVFTDEHLADKYLEADPAGSSFDKLSLNDPIAFRAVLLWAQVVVSLVAVDPNPATGRTLAIDIREVLSQIAR